MTIGIILTFNALIFDMQAISEVVSTRPAM